MANPNKQDDRVASLQTPLGQDEMAVVAFDGVETLSGLFEFHILAVNAKKEFVDFDPALGLNCTLTVKTAGDADRYFDGILTEAEWVETRGEGNIYRLVLRPWLWLLSKRVNSLIFHEKKPTEIIAQIFGEHGGIAKFRDKTTKGYPVFEYCTQYQESDMDFVRRLMEQHGIHFHFQHEKGVHTLVMGDSTSAYEKVAGNKRPFIAVERWHKRDTEHFSAWRSSRHFTNNKVTLKDYDFKKPTANMEAEQTGDAGFAQNQLEEFEYPGRYVEQGDGMDYAKVRVDINRAEDKCFRGEGDCVSLWPGHRVTVEDLPDSGQDGEYVVTSVQHVYRGQTYRSGGADDTQAYKGVVQLISSETNYAPPMTTRRPRIFGPQTARVVGDGEIDSDEYGRIKVRFHWDRRDDESRRVRVAQVWAHANWGGIFIPRQDMEVVVEFLDGDPDQPLVTGCVYNADNMPPFPLPDDQSIAGWVSKTVDGSGYNELTFDDRTDKELVRLHAERDLDSTVKNDESRLVQNDRKTRIDHDDKLDVGNELYIEAGSKITLVVGSSKITMDGMSITIESKNIEAKATLQLVTHSDLTAKHEGGVDLAITAPMVRIN